MKIITIDLTVNRENILRYESDVIPCVGHTITCLRPAKHWRVVAVDHLVKQRMDIATEPFVFNLLTVEVEEIDNGHWHDPTAKDADGSASG